METMPFLSTVVLGAVAGLTIFLGLPIAKLKNPSKGLQALLNSLATGILIFLFWDIVSKASEPIEQALGTAQKGDAGPFILLLVIFALGFGIGLLGLVYFDMLVIRRQRKDKEAAPKTISPLQISLMIAIGIGMHNFSEGLAIGQASATGAISLASILIVGFGLHNATEGFGIAGPLTSQPQRPSWRYLGIAGLIGGAPTFLGTIMGYSIHSEVIFVLFLSLAAGSIIYVVTELLHVGRSFGIRDLPMWGIFLGFLLGYCTDLILTWAGV
jgi:ZIP family zinc transporter